MPQNIDNNQGVQVNEEEAAANAPLQVVNELLQGFNGLEPPVAQQIQGQQNMIIVNQAQVGQPGQLIEQEVMGHNNAASVSAHLNINMALAFLLERDPGTNDFFGKLVQPTTPKPDLYRLWAKHFSPVGCLEHVVHIPTDWAAFFVVMLLSPAHFSWAKSFLTSQAWKAMLNCTDSSSLMSFTLPSECPGNGASSCSSHKEGTDNSPLLQDPSEHQENEDPVRKAKIQRHRFFPQKLKLVSGEVQESRTGRMALNMVAA